MRYVRSTGFDVLQEHQRKHGKREYQPRRLSKGMHRQFAPCPTDEACQGLLPIHLQGIDVPGGVL